MQFIAKIFSGVAILTSVDASAQSSTLASMLEKSLVDMPVTTAPATFLLGASGQQVPRVSSFRTFATQVSRAYDANGEVSNAVAAEITPMLALGRVTWDDIVANNGTKILSRTTISFATKKGTEKVPSASSIGLQSILFSREMDEVITLAARDECRSAAAAVESLPPPPLQPPGPSKGKPPELSKEIENQITQCQLKIDGMLTKWNQTIVAVGAGKVFFQKRTEGSNSNGYSYWITGSYGGDLEDKSVPSDIRKGYLITAHFRRLTGFDEPVAQVPNRIAGINLRYGNGRWAAIAEYSKFGYSHNALSSLAKSRVVVGMDYKVSSDLYLTLGGQRDDIPSGKRDSLLANLNWGFSQKPVIFQ